MVLVAISKDLFNDDIGKLAKGAGVFKEDSLKEGVVNKKSYRIPGAGKVTQKHLLNLWAEMNLQERIKLIEFAEAELKKDDAAPIAPAAEPENKNPRRKKKQLSEPTETAE